MEAIEYRKVSCNELIQDTLTNFEKSLFIFLDGFSQLECIEILKTLKHIVESFDSIDSFIQCDLIYKERFLEKYLNRTKNAHRVEFINFLYLDGIWNKYKEILIEKEGIYSCDLFDRHDFIKDPNNEKYYRNMLLNHIDTMHDLVLTDYELYELKKSILLKKSFTVIGSELEKSDPIEIKLLQINILENVQKPLISLLSPFFKESDHIALVALITGNSNGQPHLIFQGDIIQLVDVFLFLKENNRITNSKKDMANWISENFRSINKKESSPGSISKYLSGGNSNYPCKNPLHGKVDLI